MEGDDASFLSFFLSFALEIRQRGLVEGDDASFLSFFLSFALEIRQRGLVEGDDASFLSFYRFGNEAAGAGGGRLRFVSFFLSLWK